MRKLYQKEGLYVYRIYDPAEKKFCQSGRSLYAERGRSIWQHKAGAMAALRNMPKEIKDRLEIKMFTLVEVVNA